MSDNHTMLRRDVLCSCTSDVILWFIPFPFKPACFIFLRAKTTQRKDVLIPFLWRLMVLDHNEGLVWLWRRRVIVISLFFSFYYTSFVTWLQFFDLTCSSYQQNLPKVLSHLTTFNILPWRTKKSCVNVVAFLTFSLVSVYVGLTWISWLKG